VGRMSAHNTYLYYMFPHRNVCSSQPYVSREQRCLCLGPAYFSLGLLTIVLSTRHGAAKTNVTGNHHILTRGPKGPLLAKDPKYVFST
jgi:hypothetical protein